MLVSFFGAPSSGKTTIAANVFAKLKASGVTAEFIAERAREVIAKYKFHKSPTMLNDAMQREILFSQYYSEKYFAHSTQSPVISDSSTLLTLAYMSDEFGIKYKGEIEQVVEEIKGLVDVAFYCPLVKRNVTDPNRIHSFEESLVVDEKIKKILTSHLTGKKVVVLSGGIEEMTEQAIAAIKG
jgi:nicotinamide riboside kinase